MSGRYYGVYDPCELLPVREAAELLHVSRPTVEKYIKEGVLPSFVIGRCRRIRRVDLEAFLESRCTYGWQRYRSEQRQVDPPTAYPNPNAWEDGDIQL